MGWKIVYIECGDKPFDNFLDFFFFYLSPLVYPMLSMNVAHIIAGALDPRMAVSVAVLFAIYGFLIFSSAVVLRLIIRGFYDVPPHGRQRRMAGLSILMLFLPMILILMARLYLVPPSFIHRDIHVGMWHGDFSVPRQYLKEWTLTDIPRPDKMPNEYAAILPKKWKAVPYLSFRLPENLMLEGSHTATSEVLVNAHYERLSEIKLNQRKDSIFRRRMNFKADGSGFSIYKKTPEKNGEWDVYKPQHENISGHPDLYLKRDQGGTIISMLECPFILGWINE